MRAMELHFRLPNIHGWIHSLSFALSRSRFSVLVLIAGLVLMLSDQGQDVLIAYAEDGKTLRVAVAAAIWAFSIWGWSRLLLDVQYEDIPTCKHCYKWCRKWIPRFLGSFAFLVLALSAYQTKKWEMVGWALVGFILFLVVVVWRRPAMRALADLLGRSRFNALKAAAPWISSPDMAAEPPYTTLREMVGMPKRQPRELRAYVVLAMLTGFVLLATLSFVAPVWLGPRTGALMLLFLWGATWLPIGSGMSYVADKHGYPLITILVILALLSSYSNDNHEIPLAVPGSDIRVRPTVTDGLNAWAKVNKAEANAKNPTPFVVVATAGGGIRAAYWTATVLGEAQDKINNFSQRTFAISGVSGGSVGATVFRALVDIPANQRKYGCEKIKQCAQEILAKDFLGPLSAALLYPDLAQRFVPLPVFPDRAAALEKGWEEAFKDASGRDGLNASLATLSSNVGSPSLFLNATWSDNGRRIVASNLRYNSEDPEEDDAFRLANDQLAVLGYDLRLSTAAHNSARFPYVSPPGMWKKGDTVAGRLQDGGLFENYGAETALEILDLACRKFACPDADNQRKRQLPNIVPVVIFISSDPSLPPDFVKSPMHHPIEFGYELLSTVRSFEEVRNGRGAEAIGQLQRWTKQLHSGAFYSFRMCKRDDGSANPPLGWALSTSATIAINAYLPTATTEDTCGNRQQLDGLTKLLMDSGAPPMGAH